MQGRSGKLVTAKTQRQGKDGPERNAKVKNEETTSCRRKGTGLDKGKSDPKTRRESMLQRKEATGTSEAS